jgi:hypothetical protein
MEERYAVLNMPSMSSKTYFKIEERLQKVIGERALEKMKEAIDEEKQLAIKRGDVDENGVPLLTVVADGSWAKRSYKCNYSSLSVFLFLILWFFIGFYNRFCLLVYETSSVCFVHWRKKGKLTHQLILASKIGRALQMQWNPT